VRLVTGKTNRTMVILMASALRSHIESLPVGELPDLRHIGFQSAILL
jgi:hypothetical protein